MAAWFALGVRQAVSTDRATAIIDTGRPLVRNQARRADALLAAGGFLNPDRQVTLLRSQVALASGDRSRARQLAASVTRSEPLNAEAWAQLARSSSGIALFQALRHVTALVQVVKTHR